MFNFFKEKSVDEAEVIELKKKMAYMETDISILKTQYQRLLDRHKIEVMVDAKAKKKEDNVDLEKIIAEISTNPNTSIQKIIAENPGIIKKILGRI